MNKPLAIFDLDDTLSLTAWRTPLLAPLPGEKKKNWDLFFDSCDQDPPHLLMLDLAKCYQANGIGVAILTGRPQRCKEKTLAWFAAHDFKPDLIKMRSERTFMKSHVLKTLWAKDLMPKYDLLVAYDDEESNAKAYFDLGIPSFLPQTLTGSADELFAAHCPSRP